MKNKHYTTIQLVFVMFSSVSFAGADPQEYPVKIKNKAQAEKLSEGTKVACVCKTPKTFQPSTADRKKSFLSFFNQNDTHGCAL
jgi:hypothetical protein